MEERHKDVASMTDKEVMVEILSGSLLSLVYREFDGSAARILQALAQRKPPGPVQVRRMELEAAASVIAMVRAEPAEELRLLREWETANRALCYVRTAGSTNEAIREAFAAEGKAWKALTEFREREKEASCPS